MKRVRGSITVEATIILPVYILLLVFVMNFLNMFYMRLVIQSGLNNAGTTIAQYCYIIELTVDGGMDNFTLDESTEDKVTNIGKSINNFMSSAETTLSIFNNGLSIDTLSQLVENGKNFLDAGKKLKSDLAAVEGKDIKNYLFTTAAETGGGLLVKVMVENYLDNMKVNRKLLDGNIEYEMYITNDTHDLVLIARYLYKNTTFSIFMDKPFYVEQQVVVHPWVGGETEGFRKPS